MYFVENRDLPLLDVGVDFPAGSAFDTAGLAQITQALIDAGFTEEDISKVMGGNVLRLLSQGLAPLGAPVPPVRGNA